MTEVPPSLSPLFFRTGESLGGLSRSWSQLTSAPLNDALAGKLCLVSV